MMLRDTVLVSALAIAPTVTLGGCFDPAPSVPDLGDPDDADAGHDGSAGHDGTAGHDGSTGHAGTGQGDDVPDDGDDDALPPGCEPDTCSGHGVCSVDADDTPTCTCEPQYAGSTCSGCAFGFQDHDGNGTCELGCDHPDAPVCADRYVCDDADGTPDCACELEVDGACVEARTLTLTLLGDGRGEVSVNGERCDASPCEFVFEAGSEVELQATPRDALHLFLGWSGACSEAGASCSLPLHEDVNLSANFQLRNNVVFVSAQALGVDQLAALPGAGLSVPHKADAWCAREAMEAGLHGTQWVAWMATTDVGVPERIGDARGWVSTDGRPVADRLEDVLGGALVNPILFDQFGQRHNVVAWTGADLEGGTGQNSDACNDWTTSSADASVSAGISGSTRFWAAGLGAVCSESGHLYCFGVDSSEPLPTLPAVEGRIAFVSRGLFTPGDGRDVADALCQQEAAEHFDGTFVAALGTSTEEIHERFDLSGPTWVRPDGQPILAVAGDLAGSELGISSIHRHADGAEAEVSVSHYVRTGAHCTGDPTLCCDDWEGVADYTFAQSLFSDAFSGSGTSVGCNQAGRVFCLQQ